MIAELQLATFSSLRTFDKCPRQYDLRYRRGIVPVEDAPPLRFGKATHLGLEQCDRGRDAMLAAIDLTDAYERESCACLLAAWLEALKPLPALAVEQPFEIPLVNPDTGKASRTFVLAGKIDRIVTLPDGRIAVQEYKTSSEDLSPESNYWRRLRRDLQISIYLHAATALGYEAVTVIYDVIRKPEIEPYRATPIEKRKYTKEGKLYANQREVDETPEEWRVRLWSDIRERPDYYLARQEIPRLDSDIQTLRRELWARASTIREMRRTGAWYRNPASCCPRGDARCMYHDAICDLPDGDALPHGWKITATLHPELTENRNADRTAGPARPAAANEHSSGALFDESRTDRSPDDQPIRAGVGAPQDHSQCSGVVG